MIYIPHDNLYNKCYVVQSEDVIRAYSVTPSNNTNYTYRDYYINSDYIYKDGSGTWSSYTTLPVCLSSSVVTDNFYYRTDFDSILVMLFIVSFFIIFIPLKIFSKIFKKGAL